MLKQGEVYQEHRGGLERSRSSRQLLVRTDEGARAHRFLSRSFLNYVDLLLRFMWHVGRSARRRLHLTEEECRPHACHMCVRSLLLLK